MSKEKVKGVRNRKEVVKRIKEKEVHIHWKIPFNETEVIEESKKIYKKAFGLDKSFQEYWNGTKATLKSEISHRAKIRAERLDFPELNEHYKQKEKKFQKESISHMKKSLNFFKESIEKMDSKFKQKIDNLTQSPEITKEFHTEVLDNHKYSLLNADVEADLAEEVLQIQEEIVDEVISKKGFSGMVTHFENTVNKFIEIRSDEKQDRGRVHRSPLLWWKYLAIAGLYTVIFFTLYASGETSASDKLFDAVEALIASGC